MTVIFSKGNSKKLKETLQKGSYRVHIDETDRRPGEKYYFWEMKGIPLRLEIGRRETENSRVTLFRRDTREKIGLSLAELTESIESVGKSLTENITKKALKFFNDHLACADTIEELIDHLENKKMVKIPWCSIDLDGEDCADELKDRFAGAQVRGIDVHETETPSEDVSCFICGNQAKSFVYVGKQY